MLEKKTFVDRLTAILIKRGIISDKEAAAIIKNFQDRSKEEFDEFLLNEGIIAKKILLEALGEYFEVPAMDVKGFFFDHALLRNFPKDFLISNAIIPVEIDEDILTVAAANPNLPGLNSEISAHNTTYVIEYMVGIKRDILDAIMEYYDEPNETYIHDTTDTDEVEPKIEEKSSTNINEMIDEIIEKKDRW